jgi:hypothetical protein
MAESEPDPREYRGGVRETEEATGKSAETEGVVPREMIDDPPPQQTSDPQALKDDALGDVTDHDHTDEAVDKSAGDDADATRDGGTGVDAEEAEEGEPISRVDAPNLAAQIDQKEA